MNEQLDKLKDAVIKVCQLYKLDIIRIANYSTIATIEIFVNFISKEFDGDIISIRQLETKQLKEILTIKFYEKETTKNKKFIYQNEDIVEFMLYCFKEVGVLTKDEMIIKDIIE